MNFCRAEGDILDAHRNVPWDEGRECWVEEEGEWGWDSAAYISFWGTASLRLPWQSPQLEYYSVIQKNPNHLFLLLWVFGFCWPISTILSPLQFEVISALYLEWNLPPHLNQLLRYRVKCEQVCSFVDNSHFLQRWLWCSTGFDWSLLCPNP